jgi:hypothetical protein
VLQGRVIGERLSPQKVCIDVGAFESRCYPDQALIPGDLPFLTCSSATSTANTITFNDRPELHVEPTVFVNTPAPSRLRTATAVGGSTTSGAVIPAIAPHT